MARLLGPPVVAAARPSSPQPYSTTARIDRTRSKKSRRRSVADGSFTEDFQGILNSTGFPTLIVDHDLRIRFYTQAAGSLFTLSESDVGRPIADVPRRFADPELLLDAQTVISTGVSLRREVKADNGAWYNRRLSPHRTADNDVNSAVLTFADISELKAAEQEIEASRAHANSIVDAIHQPLVVLDQDLRIVSASPSFYRGFGITPMSAVGRPLPLLRDGCLDVPALRHFLDQVAAGQDVPDDYEIEIELRPRGRRVLLLNARKILVASSPTQQTLLAIDDITPRKQAESALEAAKKLAERANLGKSRFLAAASHDLRQPLQTIALLQGMLAAQVKDMGALKLVAKLGESLDVMSTMLNKLLDINQLEAGIVHPELEEFPIDVLLERLRSEFVDQAEGGRLICRMVPSHRTVRSDPALLEQIIRNLLSNAQKYTDHGKILLGCRRRGDMLRIEVWDTGLGIPEEQLSAIFEEFHQLDNPARERARGLGLGLSIVQRLADLLGHTIDVRSRLGKGSVFAIDVPCVDAARGTARQPGLQPPEASVGHGASVLVIEDDPAIRELLQLLMEAAGFRTATAADGKSAIDQVARGGIRPDIVIADYNLPNGMSGLDIAARLRATFDSALPVIILTGDISTDTLRTIAAARCAQANKPFKATELIGLIRSHLEAPQLRSKPSDKMPPVKLPSGELSPTVFLIDDDDTVRETMRELIERTGRPVEAFASCEAFLDAYRPNRTGCVVVDARLPGMSGLALLQHLKVGQYALPSIMITGHGEVSMAVEAMKAGAIDFIQKPIRHGELLGIVDRALALAHDSDALSALHDQAARRITGLTPREREIMDLVISGHPNKNIAADLGVSQRTVENHRASVMKKTRSKCLSDLIRLAIAAV